MASPSPRKRPTAMDIYQAIKETTANQEMFLFNLHIKPAKVREIKHSSTDTDWALVQGIEFFLQNHCENQEWEMIANALQESKDSKTAEDIRRKYIYGIKIRSGSLAYTSKSPLREIPGEKPLSVQLDEADIDDGYCVFEKDIKQNARRFSSPQELLSTSTLSGERLEHLENLKSTTVREYNDTITKVEKVHFNFEEARRIEYMEAKRTLDEHKSKIDLLGHQLDRGIENLLKIIDESQQSLQEVPSKLKVGDSSAFAIIARVQDKMLHIESSLGNIESGVLRFPSEIPSITNAPSTSEHVMQNLQDLIKIKFETEGGSKIEDSL